MISSDGDRCEWFGVSSHLASEIGSHFGNHIESETPFASEYAPVDRTLYVAQRSLFTRLETGDIDLLDAEESIVSIVASVIARARAKPKTYSRIDNEAHADLVERAKASLVHHLFAKQSLNDLSNELGVSAFHLCRIFRKRTGQTIHEFKTDLRLRIALEKLEGADLSRTAFECGFSSHSHFTATMRSKLGSTPSQLRATLAG